MSPVNRNLTVVVENYFSDLANIRASGGATSERSYYPALANLLNAVGATLRPKAFCIGELADQGAGQRPKRGVEGSKSPRVLHALPGAPKVTIDRNKVTK